MEVSNFFTRLLQTPRENAQVKQVDDLAEFDAAWQGIKETLEQPDERQLVRGISSTQVPAQLRIIVDALVYESNRTDEDTTGACLEYFLKNDLLAQLERLCEPDRPHGIKAEVLRAINNLVVSLSERFLVHNAVHRPLRRLLRSCVGEEPEEKVDGSARVLGAAGMSPHLESRASNEDIEEDLVNLMCTLASRMVAYPPLLLIFFHDKGWLLPHSSTSRSATPLEQAMSPTPSGHTLTSEVSARNSSKGTGTHHFEFLLFSYLLRFVHREGQIGDPARAGLLFLFDIAFLPSTDISSSLNPTQADKQSSDPLQDARDALGEFILDGDFAEVMAAGLGAIYSLLPSKLQVPSLAALADTEQVQQAASSGGMHLGAGLDRDEDDMPSSTDSDVRTQLDLILKLFGFLQDIIYRCDSPIVHDTMDQGEDDHEMSTAHIIGSAISEATLDAIQSSFLDNVLYPSVLECSSHDGSAVAVLTYLDVIFSNLDDGPLLRRLLSSLMDTGSAGGGLGTSSHQQKHQRNTKRKTGAMGFVNPPTSAYSADYFAEEGRFTLKDLVLDGLRSSEWTASTAALRLLGTLFGTHCRHSVKGLLSVVRDPAATALARKPIPRDLDLAYGQESFLPAPINSTDVHLQEIELYSSLITRIDPLQPPLELAAGYVVYLADMQAALEADTCYRSSHVPLQFLPFGDDEKSTLVRAGTTEEPFQHRLSPSDPLIGAVLEMMAGFLGNTPDDNVALTGTMTAIALCPDRSLAGWLLYDIQAEKDPWAEKHAIDSDLLKLELDGLEADSDGDSDIDIERMISTRADKDPFTARSTITLPAIYQILRELVKTIATFRSEIDAFDRLLSERRQGLLFADHLDEAMNIMLDVEPTAFGLPSTPIRNEDHNQKSSKRPTAMGLASSLKSFLTPKKKTASPAPDSSSRESRTRSTPLGGLFGSITTPNKPAPAAEDDNTKPDAKDGVAGTEAGVRNMSLLSAAPLRGTKQGSPSPFISHYEQTSVSLGVEGGMPIVSGPWSPASLSGSNVDTGNALGGRAGSGRMETPLQPSLAVFDDANASSISGSLAGEMSFSSNHSAHEHELRRGSSDNVIGGEGDGGPNAHGVEAADRKEEGGERVYGPRKVKLSVILDNCVILEEFIKELVAVISARRSLGVDQVGFV